MTRVLAIDAGNTRLHWGLFEGDHLVSVGDLANDDPVWSLPLPEWESVERVAVGSVRRETDVRLEEAWVGAPELCFLGRDVEIPVVTRVPHPEQVGADRLANCLAWRGRCRRPAVIIDFGTAVTFDVVSGVGEYLGGLILPGPDLVARSLAVGTSLLPRVEIEPTPEIYGRDTLSCIRRGVFGLLRGGVEFHLEELREHLPPETVYVATGGGAAIYAPWFDSVELVLPYLTLEGIRLAGAPAR